MSLLMQALKKAEHSKKKKELPVDDMPPAANPARRFEELSLSPMAERGDGTAVSPDMTADVAERRQDDVGAQGAQSPMQEPERYDAQPLYLNETPAAVASPAQQDLPAAAVSAQPEPTTVTNPIPPAEAASVDAPPAHVLQARRNAETARASIEAARHAAEARQSAKAVFVAKQKPARGRALVIVSSAAVLAAAGVGGYYVWQTMMQPSGLFPATPMSLAQPAPTAVPAAATATPEASTSASPVPAATATVATAGNEAAASPVADNSHVNLSGRLEKITATPAISQVATVPTASDMQGEKSLIEIRHTSNVSRLNPALTHGYRLFQSGDLDAARQQYQTALRQEPNNRDALLGLAAIAVNRRQSAVAADYYSRLLDLDPADPDAIAGLVSEQQGDPAQSESRLKKVLAADPQASAVLFALGNLYAQQSRWADAQQVYFRAYVTAPDNANFAFNLAVSLDKLGQRKLALEYYRKALLLKDGNFDGAAVQKRADELQAALAQ
jgi:Flp pilus assembly protein TadD